MDKLFTKTPASNFAAIALAGVMASGYMAFAAGKPVIMALAGGQAARVKMAATVKPAAQPEVKSVASIQQQVDNVANKVEQLAQNNQTKNDAVLGDATESVPVREEFPPAVNLLRNSSFEEDTNLAPRQWNYQYDSNSGNSITTAEAIRTGTKGLKFVGGGTGNYGISQPATKTIERRDYAFSIWVKPVNANAHKVKLSFWDEVNNKEAASKTFSFSGTKEWSRLVLQVSNKNNWNGKKWFPMVTVNGLGAGALYIDDAQLEEASSYTPYHFTGGGSTQSHVSILGDGSLEVDAHGNIYPAVNGIGGLGTGSNKFSELRLTKATIDNNGSLFLDGDIDVGGNGTFKGAMNFSGTIKSHLIPDQDSTYDLGSTAKKWRISYINQIYLQNAETIGNGTNGDIDFTDSGTSNVLTMDLNAAADAVELRNDTEDLRLRAAGNGNLVLRAGDGATNSTVDGNDLFLAAEDAMTLRSATYNLTTSGSTITMIALNSGITMSTGSDSQGSIQIKAAGSLVLDTTLNNTNINILSGGDSSGSLTLRSDRGGIDLSTSSAAGAGNLTLRSAGTLTLDSSALNSNIVANTGTGRLVATSNNAGITAIQLLATNGGIDISTSGVGGLGELRLRAGGSLKLDTSGNNNNILVDSGTGDLLANVGTTTLTAQDDVVNAIALSASRGGIQLSTSNASSNGVLYLKSAGTLQLDTSRNNTNVVVNAGTGAFTVGAGASTHTYTGAYAVTDTAQISLTSNQAAINSIALLATNGGIDISTSGVNGLGELRLRAGGSLKLDTSGNNNNILVDSGTGDLLANVGTTTLTAQDDVVNAIALSASRGGIQLSTSNASSNGVLYLKSAGTLQLDTSRNNTNVVVNAGTGAFTVGAGASTHTYTGAYAVTDTAQISLTSNQAAINSIALLATNGGIDISTSGVGGLGELRLRAGGSLKLDTSGNNNNILVDSGTGDLLANVGTTTLTTQDDVIAAIALRSSRGGIQLSSSNASGNGDIRVLSAGTLQLDTSVTNSNILARTGTGRIDLASGGTGTGSTAAITLAATNGGIDLSTSGVNGNGNLSLRSAGTLTLDTTASDTDINVLAGNNTSTSLTLRSDRGGIDLSSSSANGSGDIKLRSAGTLHLDTSVNSANILANTGAGRFVVTAGGTGTSTTAAIALAATNGGIDLSTSGVNGNGNLSLRSAGTLQLDTSLNNSDLLVRTGTGTVDISSGRFTLTGQNDNVSAIRLYADRGGIDISTGNASGNGNFTVRSAGTLRLDTSATNAAIMLRSGTGRIDLSGNTILVNSGAGTLDLSSNSTIKIVSATTASLWGETGTTIGRAGQVTTAYGRLCIQGSDGGAACPAGSDGRLFVQVTGEVSDDPGDVFDLAEYYPASEAVDPGTVVVADSNSRATVKMSRYAYQRVLGVVSTTPAIRINEGSFEVGGSAITNASVKPLIALVGRVPVKVSNENGTIRVGDRLVASTKAGYAMKATKQGMTLGMALEDASFENGAVEAKVMTFVNVSWYFPEVVEELEKEYQTAQVLGTQPSATAALTAATAVAVSPASQDDPSIPSDSSISDAVAGAATEAANITVTVAAPPTEFPNLAVTKALTVGKELKVAGKATFEGEVEVVADATFGKNVIIVGNLRIGGNLEVAGAVVTNLIAGASIAAGDPVAIGADGKAYRAGADKAVIGVAAGNAAAEELVKVAVAGKVGNMAGLTTGYRYFVNEAGTLTTDGQGGQGLGVAVSATEMLVQPGVGLPAAAAPVKEEPVKESVKEETKPIVPVDQPVILPVQSPTLTTTQVQEQPLVPQVGELKFQTTLE